MVIRRKELVPHQGQPLNAEEAEALTKIITLRRTQRIAQGDLGYLRHALLREKTGRTQTVEDPKRHLFRQEIINAAQKEITSWPPRLKEIMAGIFEQETPLGKAVDHMLDEDLGVKTIR